MWQENNQINKGNIFLPQTLLMRCSMRLCTSLLCMIAELFSHHKLCFHNVLSDCTFPFYPWSCFQIVILNRMRISSVIALLQKLKIRGKNFLENGTNFLTMRWLLADFLLLVAQHCIYRLRLGAALSAAAVMVEWML